MWLNMIHPSIISPADIHDTHDKNYHYNDKRMYNNKKSTYRKITY